MITPMQKISIMCLDHDRELTLKKLRELGVLHVTPVSEQAGTTAPEAQKRLDDAKTALGVLNYEKQHFHEKDCAACVPENIEQAISMLCELRERYRQHQEEKNVLKQAIHAITPYGQFSPELISSLKQKGIFVKLYHTRNLQELDIDDKINIHLLSQDRTDTYFAAIAESDFTIDTTEFIVHDKSLDDLQAKLQEINNELTDIERCAFCLEPLKPQIENAITEREDAVTYAKVHDSLGNHGKISYLQGFCPDDAVSKISDAAKTYGWGILTSEPDDKDNVPTLLKLPRWVTPIKAVLDMLNLLPGYHEADISAVFLIFFSIFFAILIGDAGYGILFLLITLYARKKAPKAPAYPFVLFGLLSVCTILWGAITGNYFGIKPDALPHLLHIPMSNWLTGPDAQNNVMNICFLIGAIHLTIAHVWNIIVLAPNPKAIAQLGWIGLAWSMYFTAINMVLQTPLPPFFMPMIISSTILILLFMTSPKDMKKDWIHHAMFPLSMVNCFVDIVSYIRLFAVGLASLSVAQSFNDMAMQFDWSRIWTLPIMAGILLLGHGLNIALCALGILVHGVRLNTLEFSMHKGLEWKGIPYQPFTRKSQKTTEQQSAG